MNNITVAVLTLSGVIIGSILQFIFSRISSKNDFERENEIAAYLAYLNAVSGVSMANKSGDKRNHQESLRKLADAKCRISLLGNYHVIQSLANFEKGGPSLDNPERIDRYRHLINTMRNSNGSKKKMDREQFNYILMGGNF